MSDFFKNPQVAAKYNSTFGKDKRITIQGVYSGMLSDITEEVAEKLIALEDNQITAKEAATPALVAKAKPAQLEASK